MVLHSRYQSHWLGSKSRAYSCLILWIQIVLSWPFLIERSNAQLRDETSRQLQTEYPTSLASNKPHWSKRWLIDGSCFTNDLRYSNPVEDWQLYQSSLALVYARHIEAVLAWLFRLFVHDILTISNLCLIFPLFKFKVFSTSLINAKSPVTALHRSGGTLWPTWDFTSLIWWSYKSVMQSVSQLVSLNF